MIHSLLKPLFLFSALAASAVLAAPADHDLGEFVARHVSSREYFHSPHHVAPGLTAPNHAAIGKRLQERGGGPKKVTNAMRFARGLPPLAPRRLYDGSRAGSAPKARSSPVPPVPVPAILVYGSGGSSGNLLGYLSKNYYNGGGRYYITSDCTKAMVNAELFAGDLTNPAQAQGYPNVGIIPNGNAINSFTTTEVGLMVGTAAAPSGPAVQSKSHSVVSGSNWYTESKVWSLGANNELFVTWTNANGDAVPLEICYIDATKTVYVNLSLSAYRTSHSSSEAQVPKLRFYVANSLIC